MSLEKAREAAEDLYHTLRDDKNKEYVLTIMRALEDVEKVLIRAEQENQKLQQALVAHKENQRKLWILERRVVKLEKIAGLDGT
jgi:hypothetical protein